MGLSRFHQLRFFWWVKGAKTVGSLGHSQKYNMLDLNDGQFSERCDGDGSFFNSNAIPIIFGKSLTSPLSRLFSLTIRNDYFSIILLILGPIILGLFTITNNRLFLEKINIAVVAIIFLDHREQLFFDLLLILGPIILRLFTD